MRKKLCCNYDVYSIFIILVVIESGSQSIFTGKLNVVLKSIYKGSVCCYNHCVF